jgi:hypothetical protein
MAGFYVAAAFGKLLSDTSWLFVRVHAVMICMLLSLVLLHIVFRNVYRITVICGFIHMVGSHLLQDKLPPLAIQKQQATKTYPTNKQQVTKIYPTMLKDPN